MSNENILTLSNRPALSFPTKSRPITTMPNSVRSYRSAPETVTLQIRLERHFATADLTISEARDLAKALLAAAGQS